MQYLRRMRKEVRASAYAHICTSHVPGRPAGLSAGAGQLRVRALTRGAALVEAIRSKTREFSASLPYSFVCEVTRVLREFLLKKESLANFAGAIGEDVY